MRDTDKTKEQLLDELAELRRQIAGLVEASEADHKQLEEALRRSEDRYKTIFELSPEAIVLLDREGSILDVNGRLYEWLEYKPEEVIGKNFLEFPCLPEESKAKVMEKFSQRTAGEEVPPYELDFIARNGKRHTGKIVASLVKDENGEVMQDLVMISDITERKQIEEKLLRIEKLESIGVLAGRIAHDFNNALTAISGNIFLARLDLEAGRPTGEMVEGLREAERECTLAQELTQKLLTLSRSGAPI